MSYVFKRNLDTTLIDSLKNEPLYIECLIGDIEKGEVFPAIRDNTICFYHAGVRLFRYDGTFTTHRKYLSLIRKEKDKYISESDLIRADIIRDFVSQYDDMKSVCEQYSGEESKGISKVYSSFSFLNEIKNTVVLDVEISLKSIDDEKSQDRIDMLIYSKTEKRLKFVEVKHFSNSQIWSQKGKTPKVVNQVNDYAEQIRVRGSEILEAYKRYAEIIAVQNSS